MTIDEVETTDQGRANITRGIGLNLIHFFRNYISSYKYSKIIPTIAFLLNVNLFIFASFKFQIYRQLN